MTAQPILRTSTTPRPLAPTYIQRPKLVSRLASALDLGVVMVIAPAGFGKTSLVAEWFEDGPGPDRCWASLSERHNTLETLVAQIIHAVQSVQPGALSGILDELQTGRSFADEDSLTHFVNQLCTLDPLALVLDSLDAVTDTTTLDALSFLLEHIPPTFGVIVCARRDPRMPLAKWRGSGRMAEVRAADLRFSDDEASLLLDLLAAGDLSPAEMATIVHASDGWPTGVYLAGVAAQRSNEQAVVTGDSVGSIPEIADFFSDEVLNRLPDEWLTTLAEISILDSVTGSLAESVTQRSDAAQILESLSEAGLFVAQSPVEEGSFRIHSMLRTLLRSHLSDIRSKDEIAVLHRRASRALRLMGEHLVAIEHAHRAKDAELVRTILDTNGLDMLNRDPQALANVLQHKRRKSEPLSDLDLYAALARGDRASVELQAGRRNATDAQHQALQSVVKHLRGDLTLADYWTTDLAGLPPGWADLYRGVTYTVSERYHEGEQCLLRSARADRQDSLLVTASLAGLAWNNARAGKLGAARMFASRALDRAERERHLWFYANGWARLALAQVAYDQGRLDEAVEMISLVGAQQHLDDSARVEAAILHSRIIWALGDRATARALLNGGFAGEDGAPVTGLLALRVVLAQADLSLLERDPEVATTWIPDWENRLEQGPAIPTERLVLAHLLIHNHREEEAQSLLSAPEVDADRSHRTVLEAWKLAALAASRVGDVTAPMTLEIAVAMAQTEGFVQMFAEDPEMVAKVGRPTSGVTVPLGDLSRELSALRRESVPLTRSDKAFLIEELTDRELAVLRFIPTRLSNREIAEELYVSINTVKSHIKNIYRKLGVTNRRDAVARAAALRLS